MCVHKGDVFARARLHARDARGKQPAVFGVLHEAQIFARFRKLFYGFGGGVRRTVVHYDNFRIGKRLRLNAFNTSANKFVGIICRYDDRYFIQIVFLGNFSFGIINGFLHMLLSRV